MEDKLRHQASYHTSLRVSTQHFTFSFIICTISSPTVRGTHVVRAFNCRQRLQEQNVLRPRRHRCLCTLWWMYTAGERKLWQGDWKPCKGKLHEGREIESLSFDRIIKGTYTKPLYSEMGEKVKIGTESTSNYGLGIVPSVLVLQAFTHYNKWGCKKCQQSFSCAWQLMTCACLDEGGLIRACAV